MTGDQRRGLAVVAINSNDVEAYPQDGPDGMRAEAVQYGYVFPYLLDASQAVAKAYRAACTPDFFLFDAASRLAYRGRLDGSTPGNGGAVSGADLRAALAGTGIEAAGGAAALAGLLKFYVVCGVGALANIGVASWLFVSNESWWIAGIAGVIVGATFNYTMSSIFVWRQQQN